MSLGSLMNPRGALAAAVALSWMIVSGPAEAAGDAPQPPPAKDAGGTGAKDSASAARPSGGAGLSGATPEREDLLRQREALRDRRGSQTPGGAAGLGAGSGARQAGQPARDDLQGRAAAVGKTYQAPSETSEVVRFEPAELDLGDMTAEVPKSGKISIVNTSDRPLRILTLKAGCGCTTARAPQEPIPVGGSVEIPVTLRPGPKQGTTLRKHVDVYIEDEPPVRFHLHGNVVEVLAIEPDMLTPMLDDPATGRISIRSVDGQPFKVLGSTPSVILDLPQEPGSEQIIHVDWNAWTEAGQPVKVTLATDHPQMSATSVIVRRVPVRPEASASPAGDLQREVSRDRALASERREEARRMARDEQQSRSAAAIQFNPPINPATTELITAARRGTLEEIQAALSRGARIDEAEPATGRTALIWAAKAGRADAVRTLLGAGARHDVTERSGKSPLAVAAEAGAAEAVRLLLEAGADPNHRDQIQRTALHWAAGLGNARTVEVLLAAKADPAIADINGLTPLLWAAAAGDPASVEALVVAGADLSTKDRVDGDDALMRAARSGKTESVRVLLKHGASPKATNRSGATALHLAAGRGSLEKVQVLVEGKADPRTKDDSGRTALDLARERSDAEGVAIVGYLETLLASR